MIKKRLIGLGLAVLMAFGMTACAGGNGGSSAADPENQNSSHASNTDDSKSNTDDSKSNTDDSKSNADDSKSDNTDVSVEVIEKAVAEALGDDYMCDVTVSEDELYLCALGSADMTKIKNYIAKNNSISSINPDEIVVAEVEDGYSDELVNIINEHFRQMLEYQKLYPFAASKVAGARLYKHENYVIFVLAGPAGSDEASEDEVAKLVDSGYEKIDEAIKSVIGEIPENLTQATE